eukprot:4117324-Pyramimonas_sp.AAC.1
MKDTETGLDESSVIAVPSTFTMSEWKSLTRYTCQPALCHKFGGVEAPAGIADAMDLVIEQLLPSAAVNGQ